MTRETRAATTEPERTSVLDRVRAHYHRLPLGRRLVAALVVTTVVCVLALVTGVPVQGALVTTLAVLLMFAALMRSLDAFVTVVVSMLWLTLAGLLFQIPLAGRPSVLLLLPVPLVVVLVASRIREYPVWHTATLALTAGLVAGFSLASFWMVLRGLTGDPAGPFASWWAFVLLYVAAGACLLWRLASARQVLREAEEARDERELTERTGGTRKKGRPRTVRVRDEAPGGPKRAPEPPPDDEPVPVDQALAELEDMIGLDILH